MGHSPSLSDLQKQNQEFNDFMAQATTNLKTRAATQRQDFQSAVDAIYKGQDKHILGAGSNADYKQSSDFSLDQIGKALDAVASAVFTGGTSPSGTTVDAKEAAGVVAELASFQVMALVAAKSFITQILGVFDTSASTAFHSAWSSKSIAPGLMLHVWCYGDSFQRQDFFDNAFIIENVIEFQLIYSFAQAQVEQDIDYMNKHTEEIEKLDAKIAQFQSDMDDREGDINFTMPAGQPDGWEKRVATMKAELETYRSEVAKLVEKYKKP